MPYGNIIMMLTPLLIVIKRMLGSKRKVFGVVLLLSFDSVEIILSKNNRKFLCHTSFYGGGGMFTVLAGTVGSLAIVAMLSETTIIAALQQVRVRLR